MHLNSQVPMRTYSMPGNWLLTDKTLVDWQYLCYSETKMLSCILSITSELPKWFQQL
jgi:hypothetical protein